MSSSTKKKKNIVKVTDKKELISDLQSRFDELVRQRQIQQEGKLLVPSCLLNIYELLTSFRVARDVVSTMIVVALVL